MFEVTVRTITAKGEQLLIPEIEAYKYAQQAGVFGMQIRSAE